MYQTFFGLARAPFAITPDPTVLYLNDCYQEAIAALAYGIEARKGFVSLVGEAGTGKTTLLRRLLDTLDANVRTVLLLHPTVAFDEILQHILRELGLATDGGKLLLLHRLHEFLLEHTRAGGNVALLIDEAQDLAPDVLEELRLLSNLETGREKILQIVLAGQPELDTKLADPALRQLRQRIAMQVRLRPLSPAEVEAYVRTRLEAAGARNGSPFTREAIELIARISDGIPRVVNVLCDASLMAAYATGQARVAPVVVEEAWADFARPSAHVGYAPPPPPVAPAAASTLPVPVPTPPPAFTTPPLPPLPPAPPRPVRTSSGPPWATTIALVALAIVATAVLFAAMDRRPAPMPVSEPPAATPPPPTLAPAPPPPPAGPSEADARALVDEFRAAYEARDPHRLGALFAPDATDNDVRGAAAITERYRSALHDLTDVHYVLRDVRVEPRGETTVVHAAFALQYHAGDDAGDAHGDADWTVARVGGVPRITALRWRFTGRS
jgi:general secretion pathway protein A